MTRVILQMRIMPEGMEVDLSELEGRVKAEGAQSVLQRPIAFGLSALEAIFSVEDAEGGSSKLEERLAGIPGVASVEITAMGREIEV